MMTPPARARHHLTLPPALPGVLPLCVQIAKWTFDLANDLEQFVIAELGDVIEFTRRTEVGIAGGVWGGGVWCDGGLGID
jgi:hypothetical protein